MKKTVKRYFLLFLYVFMFPNMIFADVLDDIEPPPSSPIDSYILFFGICTLFLAGYFLIIKKNKLENNE